MSAKEDAKNAHFFVFFFALIFAPIASSRLVLIERRNAG